MVYYDTGLCEQVLVSKGSDSFLVNLFQIPLVGFDLVLGIQWLSTLGPIWWDFNSLTMQFLLEGKLVSWSSDTPHALAAVSSLLPASNKDILNVLLSEFDPLFREVSTLPPSRSCDHRIILSAGSDPVAVHPYQYPQVLKDEIEKQKLSCGQQSVQGIEYRYSFLSECFGLLLVELYTLTQEEKTLVHSTAAIAAETMGLLSRCIDLIWKSIGGMAPREWAAGDHVMSRLDLLDFQNTKMLLSDLL
nr:putative mitochondrial protein [Ipomoea batatas]